MPKSLSISQTTLVFNIKPKMSVAKLEPLKLMRWKLQQWGESGGEGASFRSSGSVIWDVYVTSLFALKGWFSMHLCWNLLFVFTFTHTTFHVKISHHKLPPPCFLPPLLQPPPHHIWACNQSGNILTKISKLNKTIINLTNVKQPILICNKKRR